MAEFTYNNIKNTSANHILFKLNCDYHPKISIENETKPHLKSYSTNKLTKKLRKLMKICY